jgi:hypothetical protein
MFNFFCEIFENILISIFRDAKDSTFSSEHELFNILGHANNGVKVEDISQEALKDSEHMPR